jgi:hypothetical protein
VLRGEFWMVQRKVTRNYTLLSVPYIVSYDKTYTSPCFVNIPAADRPFRRFMIACLLAVTPRYICSEEGTTLRLSLMAVAINTDGLFAKWKR